MACSLRFTLRSLPTLSLRVKTIGSTQHISVTARVVEIFERNGAQHARVFLDPIRLEIPMAQLDTAHLGDEIQIEAAIEVERVQLVIGFEDPDLDTYADL
ncbi:MAG: hypothetical protein HY961_00585 [Ignavibacteriae bacterium]|nr:hypothetical protein [Ignavibacteriota bacterium]